jgi:hypothetical protein
MIALVVFNSPFISPGNRQLRFEPVKLVERDFLDQLPNNTHLARSGKGTLRLKNLDLQRGVTVSDERSIYGNRIRRQAAAYSPRIYGLCSLSNRAGLRALESD